MKTILLVSRSSGKGLKRTQAILDRYAKRIEQNSWVTQITQEGLSTLYSILKKSSSKKMAISCFHRQQSMLKLLWSIGPTTHIMPDGSIPVHQHEMPEAPPSFISRLGCLLVKSAGLAHDFGKCSIDFQNKIRGIGSISDPVRHEWISYHLYQQMQINPNLDWDQWLSHASHGLKKISLEGTFFDKKTIISSYQDALSFLIATHHRFPLSFQEGATTYYKDGLPPTNSIKISDAISEHLKQPLDFFNATNSRIEKSIQALSFDNLNQKERFWLAMCFLTRPALILADHEVSSEIMPPQSKPDSLMANTRKEKDLNGVTEKRVLNQTLNWHLNNVGNRASSILYHMQKFKPPGLTYSKRNSLLARGSKESHFYWQDRVLDFIQQAPSKPTLILNLAGTGAGKTRMNVRCLAQLCKEEHELRIATALNLRSLTLQTITSYREELAFEDQVAGVIGDATSQKLYHFNQKNNQPSSYLDYEADEDGNPKTLDFEVTTQNYKKIKAPDWLNHALQHKKMQKMEDVVMAPILACTMDFIVSAGQMVDQANHCVAMMRIMTSDLILDEIDSYEPESLISVLRVVSTAALYGRNVVASSATLSEPCAKALAEAWNFGSSLRSALLNQDPEKEKNTNTQIIFFDNHTKPALLNLSHEEQKIYNSYNQETSFEKEYSEHLTKMLDIVKQHGSAKVAEIIDIQEPKKIMCKGWLNIVKEACLVMHERHKQILENGKKVSFGLVRVANIRQAIQLAEQLSSLPGTPFQIACYHSQLTVIHRNYLESRLDDLLKRKPINSKDPLLKHPQILSISESIKGTELRLLVIATPVEEIGRDHDFDYAIIEPSSTQSIIQTAGRVQRHRNFRPETPNIGILEYSYRYMRELEKQKTSEPLKSNIFQMPGLDVRTDQSFLKLQRMHCKKLNIPPKEASMHQFISKEILAPHSLHAGLKFEKNNGKEIHLFSELDNIATQSLLSPVIGMFSTKTGSSKHIWFSKEHYKKYCLRSKNQWGIDVDAFIPLKSPFKEVEIKYFDIVKREEDSATKSIVHIKKAYGSLFVPESKDILNIAKKTNTSIDSLLKISINLTQLNENSTSKQLYYHDSFGMFER